jgi:hypothetical protein
MVQSFKDVDARHKAGHDESRIGRDKLGIAGGFLARHNTS